MPCFDPDADRYASEELRKRCDKLTRLLCEACKLVDLGKLGRSSPELRAWWQQHQAWDKKRGAR